MKTITFKRRDEQKLGLDFGRFETTPEFAFDAPPHKVDFFEILFIEQGQGTLYLDGQQLALGPSKCYFISPLQTRRWAIEGEKPKGFFVIFEKDFFDRFFEDKLFIYRLNYFFNPNFSFELSTSAQSIENFSCIIDEIERESNNAGYFSEHVVRSWLYLLLVQLNRAYASAHGIAPEERLNNTAYEFRKLVEENLSQLHTVDGIAQKMGISRVTLNKKIKEHFRVSATQFLKDRLLIEVKKALLFTNKTIAEISNDLAFSEATNMIRFFKQAEGQTPAQFRADLSN